MRQAKRNIEGASEIVGALMLTLIVVVAASSFAIFVSDIQKKTQEQRLLDLERQQESVKVLNIRPHGSGSSWTGLNITIGDMGTDPSDIDRLTVNDLTVIYYRVWNIDGTTHDPDHIQLGGSVSNSSLHVDGREQLSMHVNFTENGFRPSSTLKTDSLKIDMYTRLLNDFSQVFIPPTAIISVDTESLWNGTLHNYTTYIVLDGSQSDQPGDGYIVSWNWTIWPDHFIDSGRKVRAGFVEPATPGYHLINLTVTDNHGLTGSDSLAYYH